MPRKMIVPDSEAMSEQTVTFAKVKTQPVQVTGEGKKGDPPKPPIWYQKR